jgi:hypothetical protein
MLTQKAYMKAITLLLLFGISVEVWAQDQSPGGGPGTSNTVPVQVSPYAVAERGAHDRVWQRVTATSVFGVTNYVTNEFKEIATGLHYWNGSQWMESSDQIQITPNGAAATNSQHQVTFAPNINTSGSISLTTLMESN